MKSKHKKYILKNIARKSVEDISRDLDIGPGEIRKFLDKQRDIASPSGGKPATAAGNLSLGRIRRLAAPVGIFAFALILRLIYLTQIKANPFFDSPILDGLYYDTWAQEILRGDLVGKAASYGNPFYAYFLAALYKIFGHDLFLVRLIQHIFGAAACVLIYYTGKRLFNKAVGLISGLMAAAYSIFIFYEGELGLDSLAIFFAVLSMLLLLRAADKPGLRKWFFAGLSSGFFMLTRANILPLAVLLWLVLGFKETSKKRIVKYFAAFFAGMILIISPVTIKNYMASGEFVLITAHGGETFYVGNNPEADGTCKHPDFVMPNTIKGHEDFRREASRLLGRELSLAESSSYWFSQAIGFIRENPRQYAGLLLRKIALFCQPTELSDTQQYYLFRDYSGLLRSPLLTYGFIFPLALIGIALSLKNRRRLLLIYLFTGMYSASVIMYFITARYRMIVVPFFIIFGAYALYYCVVRIRKTNYQILLLPFLIFVILLFVAHYVADTESGLNVGHYNLGRVYEDKGQHEKAIEEYQKSIDLNPYDFRAYLNLGAVYHKIGQRDKAIDQYKKSLEINPDDYKAWTNLGVLYREEGMREEAIESCKKAVEIRPDDSVSLNNLGDMYFKNGDYTEALGCFQKAVDYTPGNHVYNANLGTAYILSGDREKAVYYWRRSLEINPRQPRIRDYIEENTP